MALFDGGMVDVTTPDGRQITVPSGLAIQFPGLRSVPPEVAQPPALPVAPPPPVSTPEDQADLAQRTAPPPDTALAAPVTAPSQVEPSGPQAPRGPVSAPAQASDAGPPNNVQPQLTNAQLAQVGNAGGYNAEAAAIQDTREATRRQGEALANQAREMGARDVAAQEHATQLLEQERVAAEENARAVRAKHDEYVRDAKAIADTKIDRSVNHPILAAIGVALGGIGMAMQHKDGNPALDALYKAIDRKVAGQMQDLDVKRQNLAVSRDELGMQREQGKDRLAELTKYRLAYIEQARRDVDAIKQRTTSDVVRSNTDLLDAGLRERSAHELNAAVGREEQKLAAERAQKQTMQIAQMSNATALRGQNLQQKQHDEDRAERAQEKLDAISAQIALAKDKDAEKRAKEVKEQGVSDPRTGDPLLSPEGAAKMAQADKEEAQARAAKDPERAQKLNEHAATLRQSAQLNDVAVARDAKDREKVQAALDSTHNLAVLVDKTIAKFGKDPSAFDRQAWAELKAGIAVVKARYVATLGERVSVKALEAFDDVLSIDEDSMLSRFADQGKAMAALKELRSDAALNASVVLNGAKIKSQWKPGLSEEKVEFGGKTAAEVGAGARPSGLLGDVAGDTISERAQEAALNRTNAKGKINSYGLEPADNEKLSALIGRSATVGHAEYERIAEQLAAPLTKDRPGLATGIARKIQDRDPKLYQAVLSKLAVVDPEKAKEIGEALSASVISSSAYSTAPARSRTQDELSNEETSQLTEQRREKATEEERRKYRKAYDERASKGTIVRGQ